MAKAVLIMDMPECCADCQLADDDPSGLYCPPADDYYDGSDSSEDRASFTRQSRKKRAEKRSSYEKENFSSNFSSNTLDRRMQ